MTRCDRGLHFGGMTHELALCHKSGAPPTTLVRRLLLGVSWGMPFDLGQKAGETGRCADFLLLRIQHPHQIMRVGIIELIARALVQHIRVDPVGAEQ
jgi:hypothetical protein